MAYIRNKQKISDIEELENGNILVHFPEGKMEVSAEDFEKYYLSNPIDNHANESRNNTVYLSLEDNNYSFETTYEQWENYYKGIFEIIEKSRNRGMKHIIVKESIVNMATYLASKVKYHGVDINSLREGVFFENVTYNSKYLIEIDEHFNIDEMTRYVNDVLKQSLPIDLDNGFWGLEVSHFKFKD